MLDGDLSNMKVIAERLSVDSDVLSALIACAQKRLDLLEDSFYSLSKKLGINNKVAVKSIVEVSNG